MSLMRAIARLKQLNTNAISLNLLILMGTFYQSALCADSWHCQAVPIEDLIKTNNEIDYIPCTPVIPFEYEPLPLTNDHYFHPYRGTFNQTFILKITDGQVFGYDGWVVINDSLIHELVWQEVYLSRQELQDMQEKPTVIKTGRVAVIAQTGFNYYYHWMVEVLGRLALLEMQGIDYDFLYVPTSSAFMKELLELWGIDLSKIIEASNDYTLIADQLIVPSQVSRVALEGWARLVHYIPDYIVHYIRAKLLNAIDEEKQDCSRLSKRVFISRQDASSRKIINEDEVFAVLQAHGFQRYTLTKLSVKEQIMLFKHAEIIVGSIGSGLTNIIFCNPDARIIELYQARRDPTIWYLSQMIGLHHHTCIKTTEFIDQNQGQYDTIIPLNIIEELLLQLNKQ